MATNGVAYAPNAHSPTSAPARLAQRQGLWGNCRRQVRTPTREWMQPPACSSPHWQAFRFEIVSLCCAHKHMNMQRDARWIGCVLLGSPCCQVLAACGQHRTFLTPHLHDPHAHHSSCRRPHSSVHARTVACGNTLCTCAHPNPFGSVQQITSLCERCRASAR